MRATLSRFVGSRSRLVGLGVGLLAAGVFPGCHKKGADKGAEASPQDVAAVKKSFDDLKARLAALETGFADLRKKIDTIPPDLPAFREVRETFFATEEGRGVMDAKMTMLSGQLDAALASKKPEDLQQLSKDLSNTSSSVGQLEQLHVTQLHQVMALQRMAERQQGAQGGAREAKQAAAEANAAAAPTDKATKKHKGQKAKPDTAASKP